MISRIWRGWTTPENADAYEGIVRTEVIPGILAMKVDGFRHIELLRRERDRDVEFVTAMWFDELHAVRAFAGADCETAHVPERARAVLARFAEKSQHYEVRETWTAG